MLMQSSPFPTTTLMPLVSSLLAGSLVLIACTLLVVRVVTVIAVMCCITGHIAILAILFLVT